MKNTIELNMKINDDEIVIEGICPHCMSNEELRIFAKALTIVNEEVLKVAKERKLYAEKKQSTKKKRQNYLRKSSR